MHFKMDVDEKKNNEPQKVQFFFNVKYRQNLNFMYGCHGYQNKIVMTPYFFMILKIMIV